MSEGKPMTDEERAEVIKNCFMAHGDKNYKNAFNEGVEAAAKVAETNGCPMLASKIRALWKRV